MKIKSLFLGIVIASTLFSNDLKLSWYSWDGFIEYKKHKEFFFKNLPATKRLFVSFSAKEITELKHSESSKEELNTFLLQAKKYNIKVELLLGDNTYAYPKNHQDLLDLIEFFKSYNFSAIQLDIEPSGLISYDENIWIENISTLLLKVNEFTKLPIGFALNHSLAKPYILKKLQNSKVDELVIMYYSVNSLNLQNKLNEIMKKNKDLKFSLALSIEPLSVLSKEETFATYGKKKAMLKWKDIYNSLKNNKNFVDIVIQSLHDYSEAKQ